MRFFSPLAEPHSCKEAHVLPRCLVCYGLKNNKLYIFFIIAHNMEMCSVIRKHIFKKDYILVTHTQSSIHMWLIITFQRGKMIPNGQKHAAWTIQYISAIHPWTKAAFIQFYKRWAHKKVWDIIETSKM